MLARRARLERTEIHLSHRILVVDDERNMRRVLQALLATQGHQADAAGDGEEAARFLRSADPAYDLVLTDLRMPRVDGMELLHAVQAHHPDTPVVVITAHGTVDSAVEAMRAGAFDFITKPFDDSELHSIVDKALSRREANRARAYAPTATDPALPPVGHRRGETAESVAILKDIIGESPPVQDLFTLVRKVAPSPTTVLLRGESGTGKELVATAIHRLSTRAGGPFITVNCTAIPETLFESELFGHERGAFTGATAARPGRFELAHGGTLFLDEIGELPPPMQVKLLRVLQERVIERVGGLKTQTIDVRLVAATNADLEAMVKAGTFREDLFYRLNVVPIRLPPLRDRAGDVPVLARHFVDRFRKRLGRGDIQGLSPDCERAMGRYPWPGNIRQLENVVERMVLLADGPWLGLDDLPVELRDVVVDPRDDEKTLRDEPLPEGSLKDIVRERMQRVERDLIWKALQADDWNVTHAARRLGISRKGLQLKMRDYGLRGRDGDA
jgi:DNA-binding NtrC family response regulator